MKYYHRFPGAKFFMPNGQELCFAGGEIDTANFKPADQKAVEEELNKIANVPSSMVYTKDPVQDSSEVDVHTEITATATTGFDQVNKVAPGTVTQALPMGETTKPTLNKAGASLQQVAGGNQKAPSPLEAAKAAVKAAEAKATAHHAAGAVATGAAAGSEVKK